MRVRVLGDLEVEVGGAVPDLGGPKPRALLGLLVAAEGRPVPVETLIDQIWGEEPPGRVEASLQSYVARLRKVLEPERQVRRPGDRLRTRAGGYAFDVGVEDVDARRFARLVRDARQQLDSEPAHAAAALEEAVGLWRGTPYAGLECPSLQAEAVRLEELRLGALEDLWGVRVAHGRHAEATSELEQLVRLHPLREGLWEQLALALYRSGRQGDALAALRRAREHLAEELGVDPGAGLRRLEEAVLRQDPALDRTVPVAAPRVVAAAAAPAAAPVVGNRVFGREDLLDGAAAVLAEAAAGRGRTVLVTGEPGIGKSRFAEAFAARAAAAGFRTGRGGWDPETCPPLWGWTRAVAAVLGREGVLGGAADEVTDAASASFRRSDALVAALRDGPPSVVVLDDVHWADTDSLRLLRRFGAAVADVPVVLVVALRSTAADVEGPVADVLAALARTDPHRVDLAGLDAAAVAAWVEHQCGVAVDGSVAASLVERTEGNPFYVTELVRLLVREGALTDPTARAWGAVPGGVRDVVRQRVRQLSAEAAALLGTAAVAGRSFDVAVVARAAGADPDLADAALESAQVLGLVDEEAPGRYRFAHALVRDALVEALAAPVRARAHAAVADAIERVHSGRVAEHLGELAEHYRLAGPAHARSGWVFARKAAERAAGGSAHDEALRLLRQTRELQDRDPTTAAVEREAVLVALVRTLCLVGRPIEAWAPAEEAARSALARGDGPAAAAALLAITDGLVWGWRTHPEYDDEAVALWETVRDGLPADQVIVRAHVTACIAVELLYRPGAETRATALADEAVAAVRRSGGRGARELQVLRLAQMALLRPELVHHRLPLSDEIVELATALGDPGSLASALTARAQDLSELGRFAALRSDVVRAAELAERHHLSQNVLVAGWCRATLTLLDEDWAAAGRLIAELDAFATTLAAAGGGIETAQLSSLHDLQDRLPELEPMLRAVAPYHPTMRELHALALVRADRREELRLLLGPWTEQPTPPRDYLWLLTVGIRAEVWAALGDREAARDLYATLLPYADRWAVSIPVGCRGSVRLHLGELARVSGDVEVAREHLEAARRAHEEAGFGLWVARTDAALARL